MIPRVTIIARDPQDQVYRMFAAGTFIGDYEIIAPLKAGGMATLFIARRVGPGGFVRPVAVKVVHEHLARDKHFIDMFLDEARICARIQHPHVVHVEDLGQHEEHYFLAMEYVHGCTLSQFLRGMAHVGRALSPELAVYIATLLADALHAAHETRDAEGNLLGLVHRDVTPQNVMVSYSGHLKLIDFGVAKAKGRLNETSAGFIKGKLRYMSPEQAWGKQVDRRTDIFALGVVLWELLTQRRFVPKGSDVELIHRAREPEWIPPSHFRPQVSAEIDAVVQKALQKNPDDRYATAQEFRRALASVSSRSFAIDSGDLATLLHAVMTKEIEEQNQVLPDNVTQIVAVGPDTNPDVMNQQLLAEDLTGQRSVEQADPASFMMDSSDYQVGPNTFPETTNGLKPMKENSNSGQAAVSGIQPAREAPSGPKVDPSSPVPEAPASIPASLWFVLLILVASVAFGIPGAFRFGQAWASGSSPAPSSAAPPSPTAPTPTVPTPTVPTPTVSTPTVPGSEQPTEASPTTPLPSPDTNQGTPDASSVVEPPETGEEVGVEAGTEPDAALPTALPRGQEPPRRPRRRRPPRRPTVPMMDTPF